MSTIQIPVFSIPELQEGAVKLCKQTKLSTFTVLLNKITTSKEPQFKYSIELLIQMCGRLYVNIDTVGCLIEKGNNYFPIGLILRNCLNDSITIFHLRQVLSEKPKLSESDFNSLEKRSIAILLNHYEYFIAHNNLLSKYPQNNEERLYIENRQKQTELIIDNLFDELRVKQFQMNLQKVDFAKISTKGYFDIANEQFRSSPNTKVLTMIYDYWSILSKLEHYGYMTDKIINNDEITFELTCQSLKFSVIGLLQAFQLIETIPDIPFEKEAFKAERATINKDLAEFQRLMSKHGY